MLGFVGPHSATMHDACLSHNTRLPVFSLSHTTVSRTLLCAFQVVPPYTRGSVSLSLSLSFSFLGFTDVDAPLPGVRLIGGQPHAPLHRLPLLHPGPPRVYSLPDVA